MPLPHNALVLVADGRKMLFFRNHGDEGQIDLRTEAHDARQDRQARELYSRASATDGRPMKSPISSSRKRIAGSRTRPTNSRIASFETISRLSRSSRPPRPWESSGSTSTRKWKSALSAR